MKIQYSRFLAILLAATLVLNSCKQSEDAPPPTKMDMMTRQPWFFLSASANGTDVTSNSFFDCFRDNTTTFSTSGSFTITEGTVVCSPSTAGTFTWSFQSGETQLQLSAPLFPGGSNTFTLVSLTETSMVLSQNVTIPPSPTPILVSVTFRH
jgi:hypothetical protein